MVPGRAGPDSAVRCGAAGGAGWRSGDPDRTHLATATRLLSLPRAAPVLRVAANQHPPPHAYLHEEVGRRRCRLGALAGARSAPRRGRGLSRRGRGRGIGRRGRGRGHGRAQGRGLMEVRHGSGRCWVSAAARVRRAW